MNGKKVAEGRIDRTQCCAFSADEGADVGADEGTPVADYPVPSRFTGKIDKVTVDVKETKAADADEARTAERKTAVKKGLSD